MRTVVVGTAGHIDHGKTSLLRALTGIDADRLPEERARGMTIDVGYAHLAFDDGVELDFVDVPGHDRLIGNMLVGAGEIDAAMVVVAADDGPRPQTLEHVQLLDALGIDAGLVVVTKTDLVETARAATVVEEVRALLRPTSLAGVPVLTASASTRDGIDGLRAALRTLRDGVVAGPDHVDGAPGGPARFAIDRVFAAKGRGVVVTGTLRGTVQQGAWLRREPGGEPVRIRELQVHGLPRDSHPGGRVAFNVTGAGVGALRRGDVLAGGDGGDDDVLGSDRLLVALRPPAAMGDARRVSPGASPKLRLHAGTAGVGAKLRRIRAIDGVGVLTLDSPVATFPGDRGVLREPAGGAVVASVLVLDLAPPRGTSRQRLTPERIGALRTAVERRDADAMASARLELHGMLASGSSEPARHAPRSAALARDVRSTLHEAALDAVATHHRTAPISPGLPLPRARAALLKRLRSLVTVERRHADLAGAAISELLDGLVGAGRLARRGDALRDPSLAGDASTDLIDAMAKLERLLDVPAPPPLEEAAAAAGCPPEGIRALQAEGRIVRLAPDLAWATPTFHRLAALALELARSGPLTPAAFRDATETSRRFVIAILEDLDRRGILLRTPEGRVPGPRAPRPTPATPAGPTVAS